MSRVEPVTFLFTDIEGSTRRWESFPEAMPTALEAHDGLVGSSIEEHDGLVFKHTGDGMCAVFRSAAGAVAAAVALQQRLARADWTAVDGLRVRAAIHTGTASERGGDYFGPALNRCARLMAAANGAQVLVSAPTAALLADHPLEGVELVDLGEHRLRDLTEPARVFHVAASGLVPLSELPRLRSLDAHAHNLPTVLSSFVGRESELAELHERLGRARLVTLTGVGGTGKTRLALQAAAERMERFPDGVYFADLAQTSNPDEVGPVVAAALGVVRSASNVDPDGRSLVETMADDLAGRAVLLVIDNCEHVLSSVAPLIGTLLARSPRVSVLATSREALGLAGESVQAVAPLRDEEGIALFMERGREASGGALDTQAAIDAVAEIVRRLDGIPLALELAAARLRSLSAEEIAERLQDRFRLLVGARRSLERQQTLRATMDWSYSLLTAPERALLARLSVFESGFTLSAAEVVAADAQVPGEDIVDLLDELVAKSLVTRRETAGRTRYGLLETVRQYAAEKLAADGDPVELRHRQLQWALDTVRRWMPGIGYQEVMELTPPEHANLRAALEWAIDLGDADAALTLCDGLILIWFNLGHFDEGTRLIDATLAIGGGPCRDRYYRAINGVYLHMWTDRRAQAHAMARMALDIAAGCPEIDSPHLAHLMLGILAIGEGGDALEHIRTGRALATAVEAQDDVLLSSFLEGQHLVSTGALAEALPLLEAAVEAPFTVNTGWVIIAQTTYTAVLLATGRDARDSAHAALDAAQRAGNQTTIIAGMAMVAAAEDDPAALAAAVAESRRWWGRTHSTCFAAAAVVATHAGRVEAAAELTGASERALDTGSGSVIFGAPLRRFAEVPGQEWDTGFARGQASDPEAVMDAFLASIAPVGR